MASGQTRDIKVQIRNKPDRKHLLLYYIDPVSGNEKSKSAKTDDRQEAERAAERWEAELLEYNGIDGAGWQVFRDRFTDEKMCFYPANTARSYNTALNSFEQRCVVSNLNKITNATMSTFAAGLARAGYPNTTIKCYLNHLLVVFRWAKRQGIMRKVPDVEMPRIGQTSHMKGRPLKAREVVLMLWACRILKDEQASEWERLIKLLWYTGLRLGEALNLSWDTPPLVVHLDSKPYPLIVIDHSGQKSRKDSASPLAPDAMKWFSRTPKEERTGRVIKLLNPSGKPYTIDKLSEELSAIGREANVTVREATGKKPAKFASAHDLRRTFGTRWALKVRPMTLQRMMRHKDLSTTLKFYVGLSVEDVGAELWK